MLTKFERVLLRDGTFGQLLRQVTDGTEPLYLATTVRGSALIVGAEDFIGTDWDGSDRRMRERRRGERRTRIDPLEPNRCERREVDRGAGERRQFVVRRIENR